ncbi:phosphoesterase PA-phosphatase related protein [Xylanimonas cellulosilytica DSM 15894]|uniref:Phosphoesterase PA-phosphatase related protein n=1 Tax=Xylanimonas cellulosilytica (strain DSM 15894 / JCM 12276 / CECT 5975 / KCTC 9989 / LMG 20990 / NBRC 107835 / XIL07) TaxID=446471 RepID=D1BVB1_XYLCX|nr:phosphatase PAP2 family protein [Xylanimonas cellulosilytica]ACZ29382.1 phosphoesterase PA-phosphatase related protein [Xylanimonas cellulosilytica DSM 15894]
MLDAAPTAPRSPAPLVVGAPRTGPRVVAALLALVAALGVHLTWQVFVGSEAGQRLDRLALEGAQHGQHRLWTVAEPLLDVVSVSFVVLGILTAMVVCLVRRRWVLAAQVAVLIGGSNATTQLLKDWVYDRPHLLPGWNGGNTLPSGHTTVAASVAVALLIAVPRTWRPAVALLGAAWTAATGISTLVGQWHRPSDVVAGVLVVAAWGAAACALGTGSTLDVARRHGDGGLAAPGSYVAAGLLALGGAVAGFFAGVALVDLGTGARSVPFEGDVTAYAGGVAGVIAVTAFVFAALLLVRQATARPDR